MRYWSCALLLSLLAATIVVECYVPSTRPLGLGQRDNRRLVSQILGFPETIARALRRLHVSTRDYHLVENVWFEKLPENVESDDGQSSALKSPRPSDLAQLADKVFDTHRLSWRNAIGRGINLNVYKDRTKRYRLYLTWRNESASGNLHNNQDPDTRTFGLGIHRRRMQFMLPVMFKLGVIITLLIGLTILTLKGVTIGVVLLVLTFASIATKLHLHKSHYYDDGGPLSYWSKHDPYDRSHSEPHHLRDKHVHVHVHTGAGSDHNNNMMFNKISPPSANGMASEDINSYKYEPPIGPAAHYYWNHEHQNYYDYNPETDRHHNNNNNNNHINDNGEDNNYRYRRRKKYPMNHKLSTTDDMLDDFVGESPATNSVYQTWLG